MKTELNKTDQQIIGMLTENTGQHMLDSGGAYGRNWERNQLVKDWQSRPEVAVETYGDEISLTVDVFHYLSKTLFANEITDQLNAAFHKFSQRSSLADESWPVCIEAFTKRLGWKQSEFVGENTYNGECALSQTLQWWYHTDTGLLILQTHNGCDVRGGYSKPMFFWCESDGGLYNYNDISAKVEPLVAYDPNQLEIDPTQPRNEETWLDTDDGGYSWSVDGCWGGLESRNLFDVSENGEITWSGRKVTGFYTR